MTVPRRVAIVMSRLPRLIDPQSSWLVGLRAAIQRLQHQQVALVIVEGTAGSDFVRRVAERAAIPIEVAASAAEEKNSSEAAAIPVRDRTLIMSADSVLVLGIRTNGNVHRALLERLSLGKMVELVDIDGLQTRAVREDLVSRGAVMWTPSAITSPASEPQVPSPGVIEIVPFPPVEEWSFLSHTTRACAGPWPGESAREYMDSLLEGTESSDHSPAATLARIVSQRRLIAGHTAIRGSYPVVCLTEVPLQQLPALHQFRNHRARWDFEPFGLCIRKQWLVDRGTRPVIYGDEHLWTELNDADRP